MGRMRNIILTSPFPASTVSIKDGDVIVLRIPVDASPELAERATKALLDSLAKVMDGARLHIVACIGDIEIDTLNENEMRRLGWVKADPD